MKKVIRSSDKDMETEVLVDVINQLNVYKLFIDLMENKEVDNGMFKKSLKVVVTVEEDDIKDEFDIGISTLIKNIKKSKTIKRK
jgi:hypothetical protein